MRFPEDTGKSLQRIWEIAGRDDDPQRMYCGVEPAALFESRDAGATWSLVRGLFDHPHRAALGAGRRRPVPAHRAAASRATRCGSTSRSRPRGVYRTDDGGATWRTAHRGVRAEFLPDKHPEFGQCVHKVVRHRERPEVMFLQNHWGLYRSDDEGESWADVAHDVPSDFGFAMAIHPHDPETVYIVPLESDQFRCTPEGRLRVYRTRDGARSWEPLTRGLPQKDAFETVLRDALCTDRLPRAGVYFGTRVGQGVRLHRRRRPLARDRGGAAPGAVRAGGGGRLRRGGPAADARDLRAPGPAARPRRRAARR